MNVSGLVPASYSNPNIASVGNKALDPRQEFQKLGQDLQSGDLPAAQADFATIQKLHFNHMHHHGGVASTDNTLLSQIGQSLQSASANEAQLAYSVLHAGPQLSPPVSALPPMTSPPETDGFSLTA
jgi:hypothetical protein